MAQIITHRTSVQLAPVQVYDSYSTLSDSETTVNANESLYDFFIQTPYKHLSYNPVFHFIFKKVGYLKKSQQENYHKFLKKLQKKLTHESHVYIREFFTMNTHQFDDCKLLISFISMMLSRYDNKKLLNEINFDPVVVIKEAILTDNLSIFKMAFNLLKKNKVIDILYEHYGKIEFDSNKTRKSFLDIIFTKTEKIQRYFLTHLKDDSEIYSKSLINTILRCDDLPFDTYVKVLKIGINRNICSLQGYKKNLFNRYSNSHNNLCKLAKLFTPVDFEINDLLVYSKNKTPFNIAFSKNETKILEEYPKWVNSKIDTLQNLLTNESKLLVRQLLKTIILASSCYKPFESVICDHKDKISELLQGLDYSLAKTFYDYSTLIKQFKIKPLMMFGDYHEHVKQNNQKLYDNIIDLLSENIGGTIEYGPISIIFDCL